MTDDLTLEMRIRQLEESLIEQHAARRELRTEVEALGDVLLVVTAAIEAVQLHMRTSVRKSAPVAAG